MPDYDVNLLAYARQENLILDGLNQFIDGIGSDDSLKFSQCFNVEVFGYYIENYKEDTIDLVRGANYHFHDLTLNPRGNNGGNVHARHNTGPGKRPPVNNSLGGFCDTAYLARFDHRRRLCFEFWSGCRHCAGFARHQENTGRSRSRIR